MPFVHFWAQVLKAMLPPFSLPAWSQEEIFKDPRKLSLGIPKDSLKESLKEIRPHRSYGRLPRGVLGLVPYNFSVQFLQRESSGP